jgi:hypothetical protein
MIKLTNILPEETKRKRERWKPIKGYEDSYEISSLGKIKRLAGESPFKRSGYDDTTIKHDEVILKPRKTKNGYLECELIKYSNGKRVVTKYYIHRLVAQAFLPDPKEGKNQINHKNGITTDNSYNNLEWVDNDENQQHAKERRNNNS